jgi:D-3-phosphoglycerate dehydrogenase / 2-oxoglutarate reductase
MKIAVLDDYPNAFTTSRESARLHGHEVVVFNDALTDPELLARRLSGFDAALLTQQRTRLSAEAVARLDTLRFISQTGHNTTHLDIDGLTRRGIVVSAASGGESTHTVELTWALILASRRNIVAEANALRSGIWQTAVGNGLTGRILGVYAYGGIGAPVAQIGRAFGMRIVCWGRAGSLARAVEAGFEAAPSREAFFAKSDIITLHLPLKPETRGIVTATDFALMKPDALLVNTSRSGLIEKGALAKGLQGGRPGRAAIDVFDEEPARLDNESLLAMPNALCTPHLGYVERANMDLIYSKAVDQLLAFSDGTPINVVNMEALKA